MDTLDLWQTKIDGVYMFHWQGIVLAVDIWEEGKNAEKKPPGQH